jgi:hypothetical protein
LEIDDLMPIPAAVTLTQEVVDYRVMRLGELGFSPQQAHDLCDARDSALVDDAMPAAGAVAEREDGEREEFDHG